MKIIVRLQAKILLYIHYTHDKLIKIHLLYKAQLKCTDFTVIILVFECLTQFDLKLKQTTLQKI